MTAAAPEQRQQTGREAIVSTTWHSTSANAVTGRQVVEMIASLSMEDVLCQCSQTESIEDVLCQCSQTEHCLTALAQYILHGRVKAPVFTCAAVRAGLPDLLRDLTGDRAAVSGLSSHGAPAHGCEPPARLVRAI